MDVSDFILKSYGSYTLATVTGEVIGLNESVVDLSLVGGGELLYKEGRAHQDAFDDLAASEGAQIAALLQRTLFAPVLEQWHPGQPHLVEFVMKRPDSDNAAGRVANIAALAASGYRTPDEQVAELTGLQVSTDTQSMQQPGMVMPPALNSLRVRYAPTMLYPPARAAFERAINMAAQPSGSAEELRRDAAEEQPLTGGELAALAPLEAGQLSPEGVSSRAATAYAVLRKAVRPAYSGDVAQSEGEEETAENRNYTRDNAGRFAETGAATHSHKGGRVEDAARVGKSSLSIEHGMVGDKSNNFKGGYGSSHQQSKHGGGKEMTTPRKVAQASVLGKKIKDRKNGTVLSDYKGTQAALAVRGDNKNELISGYKRKSPSQGLRPTDRCLGAEPPGYGEAALGPYR